MKNTIEKIVVGLSGGVDSAVSAAILKNMGYEVHGLFLDFGLTSPNDAEKVAHDLGIHFDVYNLKEQLQSKVCSYFVEEYKNGRTPNPCIVCNPNVKFKALCNKADSIGALKVATGHYARIGYDENGKAVILKAVSPKDQSYMLSRLPRNIVERLVFPLGTYNSKDEIRKKAAELNISIASKPDSMEICFIPDNDYPAYLKKQGVNLPRGNFVTMDGKVLGEHLGIHHYTVGQRKGLGISSTGRLFVHHINPCTNEVVLSLNDVYKDRINILDVVYIDEKYRQSPFTAEIKVRYSKNSSTGTIIPNGENAEIVFDSPVRAPAPGQSAVFYINDALIGSGFIE